MTKSRPLVVALHACALFMLAYGAVWSAGFRMNTTGSLPMGIYKLKAGTPTRGDVVLICTPKGIPRDTARTRGYLSPSLGCGGTQSLLKPVAAIAGDRVALDGRGFTVNGTLLPNSAPLAKDGMGRPMPTDGRTPLHTVPPGKLWLISTFSPHSYDSRYFGRVDVEAVKSVAVSWWTFTP